MGIITPDDNNVKQGLVSTIVSGVETAKTNPSTHRVLVYAYAYDYANNPLVKEAIDTHASQDFISAIQMAVRDIQAKVTPEDIQAPLQPLQREIQAPLYFTPGQEIYCQCQQSHGNSFYAFWFHDAWQEIKPDYNSEQAEYTLYSWLYRACLELGHDVAIAEEVLLESPLLQAPGRIDNWHSKKSRHYKGLTYGDYVMQRVQTEHVPSQQYSQKLKQSEHRENTLPTPSEIYSIVYNCTSVFQVHKLISKYQLLQDIVATENLEYQDALKLIMVLAHIEHGLTSHREQGITYIAVYNEALRKQLGIGRTTLYEFLRRMAAYGYLLIDPYPPHYDGTTTSKQPYKKSLYLQSAHGVREGKLHPPLIEQAD